MDEMQLGELISDVKYIKKTLEELERKIEESYVTQKEFAPIRDTFVTQKEFSTVRAIAYGLVSLTAIAMIGAIMKLVLK